MKISPKWGAWGSQKGAKKGAKMGYPPGTPPREGLGRILDGFGKHFGRVLEGFGSPGGVQMDMKIDTCRRKFRSCPQDPPREALGRVLGGFGEVWGRFWEGFGRILSGFFNKLANPSES